MRVGAWAHVRGCVCACARYREFFFLVQIYFYFFQALILRVFSWLVVWVRTLGSAVANNTFVAMVWLIRGK